MHVSDGKDERPLVLHVHIADHEGQAEAESVAELHFAEGFTSRHAGKVTACSR
jgi:hypothetical protein